VPPQTQPQMQEQQTDIERRHLAGEVRAKPGEGSRTIFGYAALFGVYADMGWYLEVVDRGAELGVKTNRAACLFNHRDEMVLGRTANGSLTIRFDEVGAYYENEVSKTTFGDDVLALVARGDVSQSSYGFTIARQSWEVVDRSLLTGKVADEVLDRLSSGGKIEVRRILQWGEFWDVSPVTFPAFEDTTVAKRGRAEAFLETSSAAPVADAQPDPLGLLDPEILPRQLRLLAVSIL